MRRAAWRPLGFVALALLSGCAAARSERAADGGARPPAEPLAIEEGDAGETPHRARRAQGDPFVTTAAPPAPDEGDQTSEGSPPDAEPTAADPYTKRAEAAEGAEPALPARVAFSSPRPAPRSLQPAQRRAPSRPVDLAVAFVRAGEVVRDLEAAIALREGLAGEAGLRHVLALGAPRQAEVDLAALGRQAAHEGRGLLLVDVRSDPDSRVLYLLDVRGVREGEEPQVVLALERRSAVAVDVSLGGGADLYERVALAWLREEDR